jgi:hypothetical protein
LVTSAVQVVDDLRVAEKVRLELTSVFNERLVASTFVSPLGIGFVVWLQTVAVGSHQALVWGALIVSVELLAVAFGHAFRKAVLDDRPILPWLYAQLVCCGLLGLLWGAATWFVWEPNHFLFLGHHTLRSCGCFVLPHGGNGADKLGYGFLFGRIDGFSLGAAGFQRQPCRP